MKKKIWILPIVAFVLSTSSLFAGRDYRPRKQREYRGPPRIRDIQSSCLTTEKKEAKPCKPCGKPKAPRAHVFPAYRGCARNGFYVNLEYLIWRARNEAFIYAEEININNLGNIGSSSAKRVGDDWDSGFRIGLGWNTGLDNWDLAAVWTYYHNHSSDTSTAATDINGSGLQSLWLGNAQNAGSAQATWKLNYNVVDFEVARAFFVSRYLVFRPFMGPRLAFLYQDFHANYDDPFNPLAQQLPGVFVGENNHWGLGPRIGTEGKWFLGTRQFSIFSNLSFSLLYGRVEAEMESLQANSPTFGNLTTTLKYQDDFYQLMPNMQVILGLEWGRCFWNWYYVNIRAGWESNYWWNQMQLPCITNPTINVNRIAIQPNANIYTKPLTLKGVSVRLRMDF